MDQVRRRRLLAATGPTFAFVVAFAAPRDAAADEAQACIAAAEASQPLRAAGRLRAAREKLLVCARPACPRIVRADCTTWLDDVARTTPSIVAVAREQDGRDVADVTVLIDDVAEADAAPGTPLELDPGKHVVAVVTSQGRRGEAVVVVAAGEKNREVVVTLPPASGPPGAPPPHGSAARPPEAPRAGAEHPPVAAFVAAGVGVVAVGAYVVFGLRARSELADLRSHCAPRCASSDVRAARTNAYVADVAAGVAVVAAAVTTWLLVTHANDATARRSATSSVVTALAGAPVAF